MATLDTLQASLDRMEREQKVRDDGLRRAFAIFTDEVKRLQRMTGEHVAQQSLPLDMAAFVTLMTTMLGRQQQLLESIGQTVDDQLSEHADPC